MKATGYTGPSPKPQRKILIATETKEEAKAPSPVKYFQSSVAATIKKYVYRTRTGYIAKRQKKHNQDAYIVVPNFCDTQN
jgi:hypothetical protein